MVHGLPRRALLTGAGLALASAALTPGHGQGTRESSTRPGERRAEPLRFESFHVHPPRGPGIDVTLDRRRCAATPASKGGIVLYHARMGVRPQHGIDPAGFARLKAERKTRAQRLQHEGKWVHLWHVAGGCANISVFDMTDRDELHAIPSTPPLFPFMDVLVTPLARHPSAIG